MLTFFRKNYKVSNVVMRMLFVITFVLSRWQSGLTLSLYFSGEASWLVAVTVLVVCGVILMMLFAPLVNLLLSWAKIISVPQAEFAFLAYCFCTLGFALLALFNLTNLFTPLALIWGDVLFPFAATLVASLLFYATTSKLYFNDVTRPHYFKMCAIYFLAFVVLFEVL